MQEIVSPPSAGLPGAGHAAPLAPTRLRRLAWCARLTVALESCWLHEESGNRAAVSAFRLGPLASADLSLEIEGGFLLERDPAAPGDRFRIRKVDAAPVTIHRMKVDRLRLRPGALGRLAALLLGLGGPLEEWAAALEDWQAFSALPEPRRAALEDLLGRVSSEEDHAAARACFDRMTREIGSALPEAVAGACAAKLARRSATAAGSVLFEVAAELLEIASGAVALHRPSAGAWKTLFSGEIGVELRLPPLDKKRWANRWRILEGARVSAPAPGLLQVEPAGDAPPPLLEAAFQVLGSAAGVPATGAGLSRIVFADRRRLSTPQRIAALPRLLEAYGLPAELLDELPPGPAALRWSVSIPAQAAALWRHVPKERTRAHDSLFALVAARLQERLRRWLPYLILEDPRLLEDRDRIAALAVYATGRPAPRGKRSDPVYDPMSPASVQQACRSARSRLPELQNAMVRAAGAAGVEHTIRFLLGCPAPRLAAAVARGNRDFLHLLEADRTAFESLVALGNHCRRIVSQLEEHPAQPPRFLWKAAAEVEKRFRSRFRRLLGATGISHLGVLLLIEATAVLGQALGRPVRPEVLLEIEAPGGARRLGWVSE